MPTNSTRAGIDWLTPTNAQKLLDCRAQRIPALATPAGEYTEEFSKFLAGISDAFASCDKHKFFELTDQTLFEELLSDSLDKTIWGTVMNCVTAQDGMLSGGLDLDVNIDRMKESPSNIVCGIKIQAYTVTVAKDEITEKVKTTYTMKESELLIAYYNGFKIIPVFKPFITTETISS